MNGNMSKQPPPTLDRRVRRTQRALAEALVQLTLERGYDAVTIRDIVAQAELGYATFFRHYADKDALLLDVLDVFLEQLLALLQPRGGQAEEASMVLFSFVDQHADLCRVLLSGRGSPAIGQRIRDVGTRSALDRSAPRAGALVPPEVAANHLVSASIALIQWWLEHDRPYSPEHVAAIHAALIVRPANELAFEGDAGGDRNDVP